MTPERWRRIEDLYHAARSRTPDERAAYLTAACVGDEPLRREVESLLDEPVSEEGFAAGPGITSAVQEAFDPVPAAGPSMSGRTLGSYHLQRLLGAGGMGAVYQARDAKLARDVAIKILPDTLTGDADRLARFEREARMLGALNHPNICAIHGFEADDGIPFLILELVEGETLAARIAQPGATSARGLPLDETLHIARQIAEALEAAHERGIVHRDLKPANIKIKPDGVVKVLDFGIAKAAAAEADPGLPSTDLAGTREGTILGTAAYMSPEQARGKTVDKRTDIWAFGCIVYEMLTGRATFAGETTSDTIGRLLERDPDWGALPATTPMAVRRLLLRCLAKDPKLRTRDMGDARIEIDAVGERLPGAPEQLTSSPPAGTFARWAPWMACLTLAAGVGAWLVWRPAPPPPNPLALATVTPLTDWEGTEERAEISPDGRFVAFLSDRDGEFDLYVSQVGTDSPRNLTTEMPPLAAPGSPLRRFGFTADGAAVWLAVTNDAGSRKVIVPVIGGPIRALLTEGDATPSWSPDGSRLAYFNNRDNDPLMIAGPTGEDGRPIETTIADLDDWAGIERRNVHNHNPVWSPDGSWIYFLHGFIYALNQTDEMDVWRIPPAGGRPERLTRHPSAVWSLAVLDQDTALMTARAADGSGPWLWTLDLASKVTTRVNHGLERYSSVAASRDGRRVVVTSARPSSSLWSAPLDRVAEDADVTAYKVPTTRALAPRFGGTSLFYLSGKGTGDGLLRFQDGKADEIWRGADDALNGPPAVSRDGTRVAIVRRRDRRHQLAIMSADGTGVRALAPSLDVQGAADWSPDGAWIVVGGSDGQRPGLFKIDVQTGASTRLVDTEAFNPIWHGPLIVYSGPVVAGAVRLFQIAPDGGAPFTLPDIRPWPGGYRFLRDGTGIVYRAFGDASNFWLLDLATKTARPITRLSFKGRLNWFDLSPDGRQIVFDRSRENSDIVLIERPR